MNKGLAKAKAEKNNGLRLTIPVKTRSPLEAFKMLRQGHPIDRMLGYYEKEGLVTPDFHFMDPIDKLHLLSRVRSMKETTESEIKAAMAIHNQNQKLKDDEQKQQASKDATQGQPGKSGGSGKEVSKSSDTER